MCGIAGSVERHVDPLVQEALLRRMLGTIRHRGPDQFGIYRDGQAALGSARLSIIDLSSGQQPISNEEGNLWIVFNGEIFNYLELREGLEARGHRFSTRTDTEVILHLYEELGPDCLKQFNGQFAIAIWDNRKRTLFLARDRLGVRPLFYTQSQGRLLFASEIKALFADATVTREMDFVSLDQIFTFWAPLSPRTVFRNVFEVPPGHYAIASDGQFQIRPFWEIDFAPDQVPLQELTHEVETFRELLVNATRLRMRADVSVGAYLSGGLDSSTIAALIRNYTSNKLETFSIAFSDQDYDESHFQQQMARHLGTAHHVVQATHADIGRIFPEVVWHTEVPVMRTSPAPMFLLSRLVRDNGYKVVLTGEGADEFLGGYDIFKEAKIRRFWSRQPGSTRRPLLFNRLYSDISKLGQTNNAFLAAFFKENLSQVEAPCYSHFIRWRNNRRTRRFFSEEVTHDAERKSQDYHEQVALPRGFSGWDPLARAQYLEVSIFLSQYLLSSQGDRVAMAHSVEGRYPFLDYRVVEYCNRLQPNLKLRGLDEKYLLKKVAEPLLPKTIWNRPKRPYRAPIHRSFYNESPPEYVHELLSARSLGEAGMFRPDAVSQLILRIQKGMPLGETDDMALAGIISSQLIYEHFIKRLRESPSIGGSDDVKICGLSTHHHD